MGRKTVSLSFDASIYKKYQDYCEKHSFILSRKIEKFMKDELDKEGQ